MNAVPRQDRERRNGFDVGVELTRICVRAVRELGLSGATVTLMIADGSEAIAAVSDEALRPVEELQFSLGEGPARDAYASGRPVLTRDLALASSTWPVYGPAAVQAGVRAVFAFPLQVGAARFGVLTLYAAAPHAMSHAEVSASLSFSEVAVDTLLDGSGPMRTGDSLAGGGLRFRSEVYQAQGMVMVDLGVSLADGLARMRAHAYATEQDLTALAIDIVAGTTTLPSDRGDNDAE